MVSGFNWWEGLIGGAAGTVVMTLMMVMGAAMGMSRMDMGLMLGSMFRRDEASAKSLGMVLHSMNGLAFGVLYAVVWWGLGIETASYAWWVGLIFGAVHGTIALTMMPVMSAMHPRVQAGAPAVAGGEEVALPPFGFGGRGFGSGTPMGIVMGHLVFGVVWGLVFWVLV